MYIYENIHSIKNRFKNIVVGLGNFDGVHVGHQKLIKVLVELAEELRGIPSILTFKPHPLRVLKRSQCPPLIISNKDKEILMSKLGVKLLIWMPFNQELAKISPEEFITKILYRNIGCKGIVVGYNYTFGCGGSGTAETIRLYSQKFGYKVSVVPPVCIDGKVVSSTLIREFIQKGQVDNAAKFLGYHFFVEGTVIPGEKRGRILGFPTANVNLPENMLVPANGVYYVKVSVDDSFFTGVANIGTRPTFNKKNSPKNIEVHLLDFCGNLYGKKLKVYFKNRIREEKTFSSAEELSRQIHLDVRQVRAAQE